MQFGKVTKIYVNEENKYAKVYLNNLDGLERACAQLNGFKSWKVTKRNDGYNPQTNNFNNSRTSGEGSLSGASLEEMDENCVYAGEYVDVHGKPVDLLQAENGQLFVNLDDVRAAGFSVYSKGDFETTFISKDIHLRHFECYLLDQAKTYILKHKQPFNEEEMLNVIERVRARVQCSDPGPQYREDRLTNNTQTKNFSVTTRNGPYASGSGSHWSSENVPVNKPRNSQSIRQGGKQPPFNNNSKGSRNNSGGLWNPSGGSQARQPKLDEPGTSAKTADVQEETWREGAAGLKPKSPDNKNRNDNEKSLINIDRIQLTPGSSYKVKVSYANMAEKRNVFYSQLSESSSLIDEILMHVNTEDLELPVINKPVREMLCVAFFEDCWYRAVVLHDKTPGCVLVELIDYGNKEEIATPLREMSEEMKRHPGQAIRCTINVESDALSNLIIGQDMDIFVKKRYADSTHLIVIQKFLESNSIDEQPAIPPSNGEIVVEECFTELPPNDVKLSPCENVMILNYTEDKLILRNKETAVIRKRVYDHLKNVQTKCELNDPKVGQLVLYMKDEAEDLHRAIITKIKGRTAELSFIDHYGGETVPFKSLRNFDKDLASCPSTNIEHEYPLLKKISVQGEQLLKDLIVSKKKISTIKVGGKIDFLLTENDDTILLSEKIEELTNSPKPVAQATSTSVTNEIKPPSPSKPETPKKGPSETKNAEEYVNITFDDMQQLRPKMGLGDYSCYCCQGNSVTLLSLSDENASYLAELDINEPADKTPHTPELLGMCLAEFQDTWSRALVTETDGDTFEILFVDYGNIENVSKTSLRRFPKRLSTIPILGINAYFIGIPNTPKVHERLKELISDRTIVEVDVKEFRSEEEQYGIEIPSIYKTLKSEGLI